MFYVQSIKSSRFRSCTKFRHTMLLLLMYSIVWSIPRVEGQFEEENKEYMGLYIGSLNSYHHQVSLVEYQEYMGLYYIGSLNSYQHQISLEEYQEYMGLYIGSLNSYHHQVSLVEYQQYIGLFNNTHCIIKPVSIINIKDYSLDL